MFGLDETISGLAAGHGAIVVLLVAFALGLRHASDPDHLVAVSTLVASGKERAGRSAGLLGAAWGAGHATTLLLFGLPVIFVQAFLPAAVESLAEALIGVIIIALAARVLIRWRRRAARFQPRSAGARRRGVLVRRLVLGERPARALKPADGDVRPF